MAVAPAALLDAVRRELRRQADPRRAPEMQRYMKSALPYHGVPLPVVRRCCRALFAEVAFADRAAWQRAVRALWDGARFREERYAAVELARHRAARAFQVPAALPFYGRLIADAAWWDLVDDLASHQVGAILRAHPAATARVLRAWSRDGSLWKRRAAIISQLGAKGDTDRALLYACMEPSLADAAYAREFFIAKAIGWALRQYARVDPAEVRRYVAANAGRLPALSRREALKHLA